MSDLGGPADYGSVILKARAKAALARWDRHHWLYGRYDRHAKGSPGDIECDELVAEFKAIDAEIERLGLPGEGLFRDL